MSESSLLKQAERRLQRRNQKGKIRKNQNQKNHTEHLHDHSTEKDRKTDLEAGAAKGARPPELVWKDCCAVQASCTTRGRLGDAFKYFFILLFCPHTGPSRKLAPHNHHPCKRVQDVSGK